MAPISPSFRRGLNTVQFELWHDENSAKTKYMKRTVQFVFALHGFQCVIV